VDGKVYRGSRGFATEFGHMILDPNGPLCHCGKKGCLEAFVGSYGITSRYEILSREWCDVKDIFDKAKSGEEKALEVLNEFGLYLSIGIKNLVEALDPDVVVLGGGMTKSGNFILELIEENKPVSSRPFEDVRTVLAELPDRAGAIGAAFWANKKHKQ
jgi:glucokinase